MTILSLMTESKLMFGYNGGFRVWHLYNCLVVLSAKKFLCHRSLFVLL